MINNEIIKFGTDNDISTMPVEQGKLPQVERMYNELMDYLQKNERTLEEEFQLVESKKSNLSRRLRDFVVVMVAIDRADQEAKQEQNNTKETEA